MTKAILFNKMRGSGREVTINLIDSGIEIVSVAGEPIAVWPYGVVDLLKESRVKGEGSFTVAHDPINLLQIFDGALWGCVMERCPRARKTERAATAILWWRIWQGVPDQPASIIWVGLAALLIWSGQQLYLWLSPP